MKTLLSSFLVAALFLFAPQIGQGQVYVGDLDLDTQTAIDTFSYSEVTGNLSIFSGGLVDSIKNLDGLAGLTRLGGTLFITANASNLLEIAGLDSLQYVGGHFRVQNAPRVEKIEGFVGLDSIGGRLWIENCDQLKSISGFGNLNYVGDRILIKLNDSLQTISGFGQLDYAKHLEITGSTWLDSLDGFQSLDTIATDLYISNTALSHLDALGELNWIGGTFNFIGNRKILNLDPLHGLSHIGGDLRIGFCDTLSQFDSLRHVKEIGGDIHINFNDSLVSLGGLEGLTTIEADIHVSRPNVKLDKLVFLQDIQLIKGDISLSEIPGLKNVDDLANVDTIMGELKLFDLVLDDLSGLDSLKYCGSIDLLNLQISELLTFASLKKLGELSIANCPSLLRIGGFDELSEVSSHISIWNNPALLSIAGFPQLTKVGGYIEIKEDYSLIELAGFDQLDSIAQGLSIRENASLLSVPAFSNLRYVGKLTPLNLFNIVVTLNPLLNNLCGLKLYTDVNMVDLTGLNFNLSYSANGVDLIDAIGNGPCESGEFPVIGQVFNDQDADCQVDSVEIGLDGWLIKANPGNYYAITDSTGNFQMGLDTTAYDLELIPPYFIQQYLNPPLICDTFKSVNVSVGNLPLSVDPWLVEVPECPIIHIEFDHVLFRRCFSRDLSIKIENLGNAGADSLQILVRLPRLVKALTASIPFHYGQDSSVLIFEIGELQPYQSQTIVLTTEVLCTDVEHLGLEQCLEAWAESPSFCEPLNSNPTGGTVILHSECVGDSTVQLVMQNVGQQPVSDSLSYLLFQDSSIIAQGKVLLDTINTAVFSLPANQSTYRLETYQDTSYVYPGPLSTAIEGCDESLSSLTTRGMISKFPKPRTRSHPFYQVSCQPIIGAYDPNDKRVQPAGLGPQQLTPPGTRLTYRVRFQNTGNDTAFNIRVIDTLSRDLDVSTIDVTSSSHPYQFWITGDSVSILTFYFEDIQLPDSNVNEPLSNGYIEFDINPSLSAPIGTVIENFADIYFDFNPPIRTDTAQTRLGIYNPSIALQPVQLDLINRPPAAPYELYVSDTSLTHAWLTWTDAAIDELGFIVYRSDGDTTNLMAVDTIGVNRSAWTDSTLSPGNSYFYRISAFGMGGESSLSNWDSTYQPIPIPPSPQIIEIVDSVFFQINVKWNDLSSFESGYLIQRSLDSLTYSTLDTLAATLTDYLDLGVILDQTYWYRVAAFNESGESDYSAPVSARQNTPLPGAPQSLTVGDTIPLLAQLSWTPAEYFETRFVVQRSLDNMVFQAIDTLPYPNSSYVDSLMIFETNFWYRVLALNSVGTSGPSDTVMFFQSLPVPETPSSLQANLLPGLQAELSWADNSEIEAGFIIEERDSDSLFIPLDTLPANQVSYVATQDSFNLTYQYRVAAYNSSGKSSPSNMVTVLHSLLPVQAPDSLKIEQVTDGIPTFTWRDRSTSEEGYVLERSEDNQDFVALETLAENSTLASDSSVVVGQKYYYRVFAFNPLGSSDPSNVVEFLLTTISNPIWATGIEVYPVPFQNNLWIRHEGEPQEVNIKILNSLGQEIWHKEGIQLQGEVRIPTQDLSVGEYFLHIDSKTGTGVWTIFKRTP